MGHRYLIIHGYYLDSDAFCLRKPLFSNLLCLNIIFLLKTTGERLSSIDLVRKNCVRYQSKRSGHYSLHYDFFLLFFRYLIFFLLGFHYYFNLLHAFLSNHKEQDWVGETFEVALLRPLKLPFWDGQ